MRRFEPDRAGVVLGDRRAQAVGVAGRQPPGATQEPPRKPRPRHDPDAIWGSVPCTGSGQYRQPHVAMVKVPFCRDAPLSSLLNAVVNHPVLLEPSRSSARLNEGPHGLEESAMALVTHRQIKMRSTSSRVTSSLRRS